MLAGLGVLTVAVSWLTVHTVFTLRYALMYYTEPVGGIDFKGESPLQGLRVSGAHGRDDVPGR